jgi:hypothetical protein
VDGDSARLVQALDAAQDVIGCDVAAGAGDAVREEQDRVAFSSASAISSAS